MDNTGGKRQIFSDTPNSQKAIETNIPVLSGIMMDFLGALFAGVAISDFASLSKAVKVYPIIFSHWNEFDLPHHRRTWIMLSCVLSGIFFYSCVAKCIWAQLSNTGKVSALLVEIYQKTKYIKMRF